MIKKLFFMTATMSAGDDGPEDQKLDRAKLDYLCQKLFEEAGTRGFEGLDPRSVRAAKTVNPEGEARYMAWIIPYVNRAKLIGGTHDGGSFELDQGMYAEGKLPQFVRLGTEWDDGDETEWVYYRCVGISLPENQPAYLECTEAEYNEQGLDELVLPGTEGDDL